MTTTLQQSIAQSIIDRSTSYGDRIAVGDEITELSYKTLIGRAAALSRAIEDLQVPDLPIGIFLPNAASYLVAILALLLAGRTSVPLDTAHPDERNRRIVGRARLAAAIVDPATAVAMHRMAPSLRLIDVAAAATNAAPPFAAVSSPERIFMISFTSGTTDLPKGVCITEQSLKARLSCSARDSSLRPDDRMPLLQSMSGAASVKFALDALLRGAHVGIFDLKRLGLTATRDLLRRLRPTVYLLAPSTFRALFGPDDSESKRLAQDVRWIRLGNERVLHSDVELYRRRFAPACQLVVSVGTTESSTYVAWAIDHSTAIERPLVPVGRPLRGVSLELIGDDGVTVAPGEIGEIRVTSATVAAGYWRDEALTAARFSPLPENPASISYRTGDYGRFLPSGLLEFVGRRDRQVKVRGNTINLGEVEAILGGYPDLGEVGIVARHREGETVLVAYCAPATDSVLGEERLRQWCRTHLPAPMQPAHFFMMTALPRLPAGKIDLIALAALDARNSDAAPPRAPASEAAEETPFLEAVRAAWTSVLPAQSFAADMSFDAAGGNSLKGLDLVLKLETLLGRPIAIGTLGLETRPSELIRQLAAAPVKGVADVDTRPVIAFFPGMWGDDVTASDFCRLLSQRFAVIPVDPRLGGDGMVGDYDADRYFSAAIEAIWDGGTSQRLWLVGYSFGGKLAAEAARRLLAAGADVEALIVLDGATGAASRRSIDARQRRTLGRRLRSGHSEHGGVARYLLNAILVRVTPTVVRSRSRLALRTLLFSLQFASQPTGRAVRRAVIALTRRKAFGDLPAGHVPATLRLFISDDPRHDPECPDLGWSTRCAKLHSIAVGGTHRTMLVPPARDLIVAELARLEIALRARSPA
jgi:acyl-CoA synthetase (AMP-forming)/AMP-acid ligase II/thioesterase domain-containing protein